jgi:1,4-dihydroxy-6-naphthoate synthase
MAQPLSIGYSPCPNDTFIFYALVHGMLKDKGFELAPEVLADVETLNYWALEGKLDITKLSFHALGHVLDDYVLLSSGAALGRGCGPLLVVGESPIKEPAEMTVAIPGRYTTAAMLLRLYEPQYSRTQIMPFEQIMPAVEAGVVDAGVIIHESRFTYQNYGLHLVRDLGDWWEEETGYPIPLGGIAARRSLGMERVKQIEAAIGQSVQWAFTNPDQCRAYIKQHAQELDEDVIENHVRLYVNNYSLDLGEDGRETVRFFLQIARQEGFLPESEEDIFL